MKRFVLPCLVLGVVFFTTGCSDRDEKVAKDTRDSHEKVAKDTVALMNEFAETLEKIKDKDDVTKYKDDLEKLAKKTKDIKELIEKLSEPTKEYAEKLDKEYGPKIDEATARMRKAMKNVPPDARKAIAELNILQFN